MTYRSLDHHFLHGNKCDASHIVVRSFSDREGHKAVAFGDLPFVVGRFCFLSTVSLDSFNRLSIDVLKAQVFNQVVERVDFDLSNRAFLREDGIVSAGTLADHLVGHAVVHGEHDRPDSVGDSVVHPGDGQRV